MKKLATLCFLLLLGIGMAAPLAAQTFPVDTLVKTGSLTRRINLVFVPDGYQASEMPLFLSRVNQVLTSFFGQTPFQEYQPYFNAFAIKVPSAQSGTTHPRTAPDCASTPSFAASTYFNSTFDYGGIHRLLVPQSNAAIAGVLATNFPRYDQVFVLVNHAEYGGSGGTWATASANASATEIMVHEIGHSFAGLSDEYWAGPQYARESANMTQTTSPTTVRWSPWMNTNGIGIISHATDPSWKKPHAGCKMQYLGPAYPFCAVCREAFVEKIHTLVSPLQAYTPTALSINAPTQNLNFALSLLAPAPNTLKVTWTLDGAAIGVRNAPTATVALSQLPVGSHVVRATVTDTTALTRRSTHAAQHTYTVNWTINRTTTAVRMASATAEYEVETYPNPVGDLLNLNYTLPRTAPVVLTLHDAAGRTVKTLRYNRQAAGRYQYQLRPEDLGVRAAGTYTLLINVDGVLISRQLTKE
ncbi:M64 family metallo-endopeptidase [Hymenobacter sp. 5317J-9]|uniref:M64 family metallopeptidase n=1 Tax=Hymenobacter sp. 5317J-9 TaxID=2932250 RepID=UPI001FD63A42|nr:M64 family metallopeptidase [Hymenobacter sp. 5317J-9]UOQ97218.1 M64 family metallo-endopeptidase [Hymenobacter sp. 5317J-9]